MGYSLCSLRRMSLRGPFHPPSDRAVDGKGFGSKGEDMDPIKDSASSEPIRLGNGTLTTHRHVCAFFDSADEEYGVLLLSSKKASSAVKRLSTLLTPGFARNTCAAWRRPAST